MMLVTSCVAAAQTGETDDDRARELFDNGAGLFEEGRYDEAIDAWQSGYSLSARPLFLYNLAGAYERLGDLNQTVAYLNMYRAHAPESERDTLARRISVLEQRISEQPAESGRRFPVAPVALASVSAASLAVGVGFGASSLSSRARAKELCVEGLCEGSALPAVRRNRRHAVVADTALVVGIAAAGLGVAVWASQRKPVTLRVDGSGLMLQGRF